MSDKIWIFIATVIVIPLLLTEFGDWCPWLAGHLVSWSARRLGNQAAGIRYEEEWTANLNEVPGSLARLVAAIGYMTCIPRMRWSLRDGTNESAPQNYKDHQSIEYSHQKELLARVVEAGLAERRRLERDLHDGAQQGLLVLAARLTAAMTQTTDPAALAAFQQARADLSVVLRELRELGHGIHPAVLTHTGLSGALGDIAERLPIPVQLTVPSVRLDATVEVTAYFVACEALANILKHAKALCAIVTVDIVDGQLAMEISDDGVGGACHGGHGLANMLDRVNSLNGQLTVSSLPGQGTRIAVRIPCP